MTRRFKFRVLFILLALFAVAVPMAVTYTTSYSIAELKKQKLALEAQASTERNAIRVLQAEWAYLAEPSRIERLAALHLKMNKGGVTQVALAKDLNRVLMAKAVGRGPEAVSRKVVAVVSTTAKPVITKPTTVAATSPAHGSRPTASGTPDTVQLVLASFKAQ